MWRSRRKKEGAPPLSNFLVPKVLLLVDWDNLFICLYNKFKQEMRLEYRIGKMVEWVQNEIGELLEGHGFVFAPEHLSVLHQQMCVEKHMRLITCHKRQIREPSGKIVREEDTVDETLIWFGKLMLRHPDVKFICVVSGDDGYVSLMEDALKYGVKRALVPPTVDSLSRKKNLVRMADKHPKTLKRMLLSLDTL